MSQLRMQSEVRAEHAEPPRARRHHRAPAAEAAKAAHGDLGSLWRRGGYQGRGLDSVADVRVKTVLDPIFWGR